MNCCDKNCKTPEEIIRNHMMPIEIIGCNDEELQNAHFKYMCELLEDSND